MIDHISFIYIYYNLHAALETAVRQTTLAMLNLCKIYRAFAHFPTAFIQIIRREPLSPSNFPRFRHSKRYLKSVAR